jgi:hypothetical protein
MARSLSAAACFAAKRYWIRGEVGPAPFQLCPRAAAPQASRERWVTGTSAERSEAREDGVSRGRTFRVASPLVMATRRQLRGHSSVNSALKSACDSSHYPRLRRGVVPHETTIDAYVDRSGCAALRLRLPFGEIHAKASEGLRTRRSRPAGQSRALGDGDERGAERSARGWRFTRKDVSCGITFGDGDASATARSLQCQFSPQIRVRLQPLPPASLGVVPHETTIDAYVDRSGCAALRLRLPFGEIHAKASAQATHLGPPSFQ